jgi:hypothetical protein
MSERVEQVEQYSTPGRATIFELATVLSVVVRPVRPPEGSPYRYRDFSVRRGADRAPCIPDGLGSNRSNNPYKNRAHLGNTCSTPGRTRVEQVEQPGQNEPYAEVYEADAGPLPGLLALRPLTTQGGVLGPWVVAGGGW